MVVFWTLDREVRHKERRILRKEKHRDLFNRIEEEQGNILLKILSKFIYPWICNRSAELNVFGVEEIALASMHVRDLEVTLQCFTVLLYFC